MRPFLPDIFACPRCHAALRQGAEGSFRCTNGTCALAGGDFPEQNGTPVLVDFEASILTRDAVDAGGGTPGVERHLGLKARLRNLITGPNAIAAPNAERMLAEMTKTGERARLLIIGSGEIGAGSEAFYAADIDVVGIDIYGSEHVDAIADGHRLPFVDGAFDGVWVQAVLQHVLVPEEVVGEIHRVLKPDGLVYAETSFMQSVCERGFDFIRYTRSGHRWLFRHFAEVASGNVGGPGQSAVWALRYLFRGLFRSEKIATLLSLAVFPLRFLDRLIPADFASDAANGVWFLGRRSETALSPREMPGYYPGARIGQ
jgi:SAM-dependent methyltransferase